MTQSSVGSVRRDSTRGRTIRQRAGSHVVRFGRNPLGYVSLLLLLLARRFWDIRIGWIMPGRMGHFIWDVGLRYAERQVLPSRSIDLYCLDPSRTTVQNTQWLAMFRRSFIVTPLIRPLVRELWQLQQPGSVPVLEPHRKINGSRDTTGLLERAGPSIPFTPEEAAEGRRWLQSLGWTDSQPFVCLMVRDSRFIERLRHERPEDFSAANTASRWAFRDTDIAEYRKAAEWLADQGVWVLRMGADMERPMGSRHPQIVDYAFRDDRNELLDIWLFANCDLCITTGTGPDAIADVYRRPLLMVNLLPAVCLWSWSNAVTAPTPLVWRDSGRRLTVDESIAANHWTSEAYARAGIDVRHLDEDAIRAIVEEAWLRLDGRWGDGPDDVRRNEAAWAALEGHPEFASLHGYRHPEARFSSVWLKHLEDELAAGRLQEDR